MGQYPVAGARMATACAEFASSLGALRAVVGSLVLDGLVGPRDANGWGVLSLLSWFGAAARGCDLPLRWGRCAPR